MREIMFRVWNEDRKHWDTTDPYCHDSWYAHTNHKTYRIIGHTNDAVLEQYTGLKDKNGVEIYEGDIVDVNVDHWRARENMQKFVVVWDLMHDGWRLSPIKKSVDGVFGTDMDKTETISGWGNGALEVIGNIHENGDLLK